MSTVNQITGGVFMDSLGNPLSNGYLTFDLRQDCVVNTTTELVSKSTIKIPLDSNGNIVVSPAYSVWPNDVLSPASTYYLVSAYTSTGQLVWGPDNQIVLSSPSPFNIGVWVP